MYLEPTSARATRRIVVATRSADKLREIQAILHESPGLRGTIIGPPPVGRSPEEEELERFDSFAENASAKALYFAQRTGCLALADDSGLCVDALGGAPGVRSKRFASDHGEVAGPTDAANNALLLRQLRGVEPEARSARYICAVAIATPAELVGVETGSCEGMITEQPQGDRGFGYDPVFWVSAAGATFGVLPSSAKQRLSHRAQAIRAAVPLLLEQLRR